MENFKKSENLKLLPIAVLLIITPLLSTSLRFKYLYFIVNILIVAVGADAGLLSFFLHSDQDSKNSVVVSEEKAASFKEEKSVVEVVEKCLSEKVEVEKPGPSIFFIGGDAEDEMVEEDEGEDQELYQKSEMFIGNFYKQLKMQREESWNKLHHHLSHNPF